MSIKKLRVKYPGKMKCTAIQFVNGNFDEVEQFVGGDAEFRDGELLVATPQGPLYMKDTDWICRDSHGNFAKLTNKLIREDFESDERGY